MVSPRHGIRRRVGIRVPTAPPSRGRGPSPSSARYAGRGKERAPAGVQAEAHGGRRDGQGTQAPRRAAVHACRSRRTMRAGGRGCTGTRRHEDWRHSRPHSLRRFDKCAAPTGLAKDDQYRTGAVYRGSRLRGAPSGQSDGRHHVTGGHQGLMTRPRPRNPHG